MPSHRRYPLAPHPRPHSPCSHPGSAGVCSGCLEPLQMSCGNGAPPAPPPPASGSITPPHILIPIAHISSQLLKCYGRNHHICEKAPCSAMKPNKYEIKLKAERLVWSLRLIYGPASLALYSTRAVIDASIQRRPFTSDFCSVADRDPVRTR